MSRRWLEELRNLEPRLYSQAEAKSAREAFDAAAKNDWAKAGEAKYKQLLNHFLYREAAAGKSDRTGQGYSRPATSRKLRKG